MIDYLRHMAIFSLVAEKGSFSEAAKTLGIAPSRVSEAVSKLEHFLDAKLLHRTTRKVTLTSEGRQFYTHTSAIIEGAEKGINALMYAESDPSGTLKISVPSFLTSSPILKTAGIFADTYSKVHISIAFTDAHVDPIKDAFDLCIRAGKSEDKGLESQKLGEVERVIVVGRGYYAKNTAPQHPNDLENWDWITYRHKKRKFSLVSRERKRAQLLIDEQSKLQTDNFDGLCFLTKQNLGVSIMPIDCCRGDIEDGALVRLLEDWSLAKFALYAVWPGSAKRTNLASLFAEFLTSNLKNADT
ncbi:LysR family transcriptional regulator [Algirhabdus cladophorae]|uniref:LysR family transcriptional regulator n=1 Tax=Algirhabdus cladophorae TaxID=3377108 RepID=UPI003B846E1D